MLSHQFLDQLLPEVRSAALGNAGSMLLFRMGGGDAAQFSLELGRDWPASRLADLPSYHAVLCSTAEGGPPVARVILTAAPSHPSRKPGEVEGMLERSRQRFGSDGGDVERSLERWMERKFR